MKRSRVSWPHACMAMVVVFCSLLCSHLAVAQNAQRVEPVNRSFLAYFKYPSVTAVAGEKLQLELILSNTGNAAEQIALSVVPDKEAEGWTFIFQTRWEPTQVSAVTLLTEEPNDSVTLQFVATPPDTAAPGTYRFTVRAESFDGQVQRRAPLVVALTRAKEVVEEQTPSVELTADYPSIEGEAGTEFKFAVKLHNGADEDVVFDLGAEFPPQWRGYVTPRWEEDKRVSSIKVGATTTETLLFTLIPPAVVEQGTYPVKFIVSSGELRESIEFTATVTGTYELMMGTDTGRYNVEATAGEEKTLTLYLWNEGTAPMEGVSLFALDTPQDWEIRFSPDTITSLASYEVTKKPEKVQVSITAPPRTLPGDYMFTVRAVATQEQTERDIRVTVERSTTWGWTGIVIVVVIIAALVVVFMRLGRR